MSVPSNTYSRWGLSSLGLGGGGSTTSRMFNTVLIALEIVGWDVPKILANACCDAVNNDWDFDRITESIKKL